MDWKNRAREEQNHRLYVTNINEIGLPVQMKVRILSEIDV